MRIAIISDIHDNLSHLETALSWLNQEKIEKIICLGDITNLETASYLARNFSGEILVIRGNADLYEPKDLAAFPNFIYQGEYGFTELGDKRLAFCHEPNKIEALILPDKRSKPKLDIIFHGHTHKPWIERRPYGLVLNPGNLSGHPYAATFAVFDTRQSEPELKILSGL